MVTYGIAVVLGAVGWSLAEYLIHRFDGHGMKGKTPFSREHLAHHADSSYFAPSWKKALAAAPVLTALGFGAVAVAGLAPGLVFTLSFAVTYLAYEVLHRRIHTHAPRNAYGRWARRHHLYHHHKSPRANHGVTSPVWDLVFGTWRRPPARLRVPRKQAMPWLVDAAGDVRPEHAGDYELAGARRAA